MKKTRQPPPHLTRKSKTWFCKVTTEYEFSSEAEWSLLEQAAGVLDRLEQCRKRIEKDGLTVATGQGGCKPHPCLNSERDNRVLFARLCRELRLVDPADDERIPRIGGR